jgi:hypothetical protein
MSEKQWLQRTLIADVVYMEANVKAYKSGQSYYYFVDGKLYKIDQGMIPPKKIQLEINSNQNVLESSGNDRYENLRKIKKLKEEGILSEDEFQIEKKRILYQP